MEMVLGIAIGGAIETMVLIGVVFIGMKREESGWRDRWAEHRTIATDRVRADHERWRCMDKTCAASPAERRMIDANLFDLPKTLQGIGNDAMARPLLRQLQGGVDQPCLLSAGEYRPIIPKPSKSN